MEEIIYNFFNSRALYDSLPFLARGMIVTVQLALVSLGFSLLVGLFVAVLRHRNFKVVNWFLIAYIDIFRAVPPVVLLMFVYYGLPFVGIQLSAYLATVVSFSLYVGAYAAEILRSGIEAIPSGQIDAARSLGMSYAQMMRFVVLPQALRIAIPPLTSESMSLIKLTSVAFVVALPELLNMSRMAQSLTANSTPLVAAAAIYLIVLSILSRLIGVMEAHLRRRFP